MKRNVAENETKPSGNETKRSRSEKSVDIVKNDTNRFWKWYKWSENWRKLN